MTQAVPAIYQCLAAARAAIDGYIQKDTSAGQGRGVSHDAVTAHTRQALIDAGVLVLPSLVEHSAVEFKTKSGAPMLRFEAVFDIAFVAVEDGSAHAIRVPAHGIDQGDKATGKAESYALKTALLKVLSIETGEDDESRVEAAPSYATPDERERIAEGCERVGLELAVLLEAAGAASIETFPADRVAWADRQISRREERATEPAA